MPSPATDATDGPRVHGAERALYAVGLAALAASLVLLVVAPGQLGLALYLLSHVLRVLRLAYLVVHPTVRTRRAVAIHLYCTGLAVVVPFKLSELVRIRQVGLLRGNVADGIVIVWIERVLDATALAVVVVVALVAGVASSDALTSFLVVSGLFVAATVIAATVVPSNARDVMLHLMRRDYGEWSLVALRALRATVAAVGRVPQIIERKVPTLMLVTAGVWLAEIGALHLALDASDLDLGEIARTLLTALAGLSLESTAISAAAGDRLVTALPDVSPIALEGYRGLVLGTALIAGVIAGASIVRRGGTTPVSPTTPAAPAAAATTERASS